MNLFCLFAEHSLATAMACRARLQRKKNGINIQSTVIRHFLNLRPFCRKLRFCGDLRPFYRHEFGGETSDDR